MKYTYIFFAAMFAVISTNINAADQNPKPVDLSETLKDCTIVEEAFFVTVYRRPDGTHLAFTAFGDRHIETEAVYNEKYPAIQQDPK